MDNTVTKEQMAQIARLLADGRVSASTAQEFIDRHSPPKPDRGLTVYRSNPNEVAALPNELVDLWEKAFPSRGIRVATLLQRIVTWQPKLSPPMSGLAKKVRQAFAPWTKLSDVDVSSRGGFWHSVVYGYWETDQDRSQIQRIGNLWDADASLSYDLIKQIREGDGKAIDEFRARLKECLRRTREELIIRIRTDFQCEENWSLVLLVDEVFFECVQMVCGFELVGRSELTAKYLPFLELWLAGNFPVGFAQNRAKILVKS